MKDPAKALEKLKTSALGAATVRAFGALEPDEKIRNPDNLAREFLDPAVRPEPGPATAAAFQAQLESILPGAYHFQNARTAHFDACLTKAIGDGFKQIIILGAGFDTRAYRLGNEHGDIRFFEVDAPELQAEKRTKIASLFGRRLPHVDYLPLNFNTEPLANITKMPGYDASQPSFFIWEGVSYYLTAEGIDATLAFISQQSAPGSRIVFDYMPRSMVDGTGDYYGGGESRAYMAKFGEPLLFGIEDADLEHFLHERGFDLTARFTNRDLENNYLIDSHGKLHGRVSGYVRIAEAATRPG